MKRALVALCVCFLVATPCYAKSVVHLKDGNKVSGDIIERTDDYVKLNFEGIELTYWSDQIEKLEVDEKDRAFSNIPQKTAPNTVKEVSAVKAPEASLPAVSAEEPLEVLSEGLNVKESLVSSQSEANRPPLTRALKQPPLEETQAGPRVASPVLTPSVSKPKMTPEQARAALVVFGLVFMGIAVLAYIFFAFCLQLIAKKTSTAHVWLAWIPIANLYLMCRVANKPPWWLICLFIPFLNLIFIILLWMGIAAARNKPGWLGLLMLVPGVNIFIPVYLAFSK